MQGRGRWRRRWRRRRRRRRKYRVTGLIGMPLIENLSYLGNRLGSRIHMLLERATNGKKIEPFSYPS